MILFDLSNTPIRSYCPTNSDHWQQLNCDVIWSLISLKTTRTWFGLWAHILMDPLSHWPINCLLKFPFWHTSKPSPKSPITNVLCSEPDDKFKHSVLSYFVIMQRQQPVYKCRTSCIYAHLCHQHLDNFMGKPMLQRSQISLMSQSLNNVHARIALSSNNAFNLRTVDNFAWMCGSVARILNGNVISSDIQDYKR